MKKVYHFITGLQQSPGVILSGMLLVNFILVKGDDLKIFVLKYILKILRALGARIQSYLASVQVIFRFSTKQYNNQQKIGLDSKSLCRS